MMTFTGLFGLAAPEPNPARWIAVAGPILLASWLVTAKRLLDAGHGVAAHAMLAAPVVALGLALLWAVTAA